MNYWDYVNWANEYKQQVEVLDKKLQNRKNVKSFPTAQDRLQFENATRILYSMKLDCMKTAAILDQKAESLRAAM